MARIDALSTTSLYLKLYVNGQQLSTATGIVVRNQERAYLVTNWHVLSGRNTETGQPLSNTAALPDEVRIAHHLKDQLGTWRFHGEPLNKADGSPRWMAHHAGPNIDVAALELTNLPADVQLYPFDLALANADMQIHPAMPISVIGFPLGLRPNAFFPIWKTGHIATDPELDYGGRPAFLIDATTREGMSGSPVVVRRSDYIKNNGTQVIGGAPCTRFLGLYSGRIHDDSEIGCVWRPGAINDLFTGART